MAIRVTLSPDISVGQEVRVCSFTKLLQVVKAKYGDHGLESAYEYPRHG